MLMQCSLLHNICISSHITVYLKNHHGESFMTMSKYVPSSSLGFFVTVSSVSPLAFRLPV